MEFKNILDINIDVEARDLAELFEDALSDVQENFEVNFKERQMSDWVGAYGLTAESTQRFDEVQNEILRKACVLVRSRWERNGH